jgi:hypothetical protein
MHIIGKDYTLHMVDENMAEEWAEAMKIEAEASKALNNLIKTPEPFKKDTKWRAWKESILTYLHLKKGQANVPLAYIVREYDYPLPGMTYQTVHDELVASAILHGPEYNTNNGIVYNLLQSLTLNGPAWAWISTYEHVRDGRNAWKALINYYKGDSMKTRSKQECYDAIANRAADWD